MIRSSLQKNQVTEHKMGVIWQGPDIQTEAPTIAAWMRLWFWCTEKPALKCPNSKPSKPTFTVFRGVQKNICVVFGPHCEARISNTDFRFLGWLSVFQVRVAVKMAFLWSSKSFEWVDVSALSLHCSCPTKLPQQWEDHRHWEVPSSMLTTSATRSATSPATTW